MLKNYCLLFVFVLIITACSNKNDHSQAEVNVEQAEKFYNPAAPGFNEAGSDEKAISIADSVMEAIGGRKAFDQNRFFGFDFFGFRKVWWDKKADSAYIELNNQDLKMLVDLKTKTGRVWKDGQEFQNKDSVSYYSNYAYEAWVNDTYWLLMPFKLKDSGVTLKYLREDTVNSNQADVLELTFESVGVTPQNKYEIYVDRSDNLIRRWSYFRTAEDTIPSMSTPWEDYKRYNGILLASGRGKRSLNDIVATNELKSTPFFDFYK